MHALLMMPTCALIGAVLGMIGMFPFGSRFMKIGCFAGVLLGCFIALILGGMQPDYSACLMIGPLLIGIWWWRKTT